ncbi:DinB family protein [Halalkalibacterium halodurans]|uniref:DinB family protein n=1 Tax=Halalkalibacterium halodurans TaxID=86665 RepID=UPI002AA9EEBB|nr:DinB family protein [Halalkalibacterium halodurans]MDY7222451.1 DinB family protein [Halalkalibacterium halodurans]MDY7241672.1 DinB family protein [Halalkalibacterium halodurans]
MLHLFLYNWDVRSKWFDWCENLSFEQLTAERIGGVGSILQTLFHIVDVEHSWIRAMKGEKDLILDYESMKSLTYIRQHSEACQPEIYEFLQTWTDEQEEDQVDPHWLEGTYRKGEILRHVIAHEIHHMGQLSVWARELGREPISANYIDR